MASNQRRPSRISANPTTIAIACAILAVITIIWAVVNQGRISSLQDEVSDLRQDNSLLRENANATAYTFESTETTPPNLNGVAYIGTSGSGVVLVNNLPPAGDNGNYQVWLINDDDSAVAAGSLFISGSGHGFGLIPADATGYKSIAISLETSSDAQAPSGGFLLIAEVNAGRGEQPLPMATRLLCQNHLECFAARN